MKTLTVSLFVCAMMALTQEAESTTDIPFTTDAESLTDIAFTTENDMGGWVPSCPHGWTMFHIRCLLYVPENMTWAEAEKKCRSMQGGLASVLDTESSGEIDKMMQSAGHKNGQIWVGGCDTEDPSWHWSIHDWSSEDREPFCLQKTSGEDVSGCLDKKQCGAHLPSICSIIIM